MPFAFAEICTLLSRLEDIELRVPPILLTAEKQARAKAVVESWFKSHRSAINGLPPDDAVALLSALLPERRTDRVYNLQSPSLCRVLGRCLGLSAARAKDLEAWNRPGTGDLAQCLERVMKSGGPPALPVVRLDEVDAMLALLAGRSRFSDPDVKLPPSSSEERDRAVGNIVKRLDPVQAKWLVRLILKNFSPVALDESLLLRSFHFLLPDLLRFQNNFTAAIELLTGPLKDYPARPDPRSESGFRESAAPLLQPVVGVKVGRPTYHKARSIDGCLSMCGRQQWVLERKYDGEYCEIHVDPDWSSNPAECIKIFSKSGKDSTDDRREIIPTLVECLRLGHPDCKIQRQAILLGELLVYSDHDKTVLPFEKLRKYVSRSGVFLGTDADSLPRAEEHLAIVFFDLLLLDDDIVMARPLVERRQSLRAVYTKITGRAMGAEWKIVNFADTKAARRTLINQFAASNAERSEGLVLKSYSKPYFTLHRNTDDAVNGYIKLKRDYIAGMGDEADFAVVGGSYKSQQALECGMPNLRWTAFYLGCLVNKEAVLRYDVRPRYQIVGSVQAPHCVPNPTLEASNSIAGFCAEPYVRGTASAEFDIVPMANTTMDTVFNKPLVFEVLGAGYVKPPNCSFFTLRHARVKKLHQDRSWKDCISMQELQAEAAAARDRPADGESQETRRFIEKLEAKCRKKIERMSTPRSGCPRSSTSSIHARGSVVELQITSSNRTKRRRLSTASAKENDLDRTTLINSTPRKELEFDAGSIHTPCPAAKRQRRQREGLGSLKSPTHDRQPNTVSTPLSDITNKAPYLPPAAVGSSPPLNTTGRPHSYPTSSSPTVCSGCSPSPQQRKCANSDCIFSNAVVYAAPCIASMPYVMQDLLTRHDIITTPTLMHWDRDSFAYPPLTAVVSESQAYAGMRKIVLVERRRSSKKIQEVVKEVLELNGGSWRERVEFWDWRVLESAACAAHERHSRSEGNGKHYLGATAFDGGAERAVFLDRHVS